MVLVDLALRIFQIGGEQLPARRGDRFQQMFLVLGNDRRGGTLGMIQIDSDQRIIRSIAVGADVEFVVDAIDDFIIIGEPGQQDAERRFACAAEEDFGA